MYINENIRNERKLVIKNKGGISTKLPICLLLTIVDYNI